MPEPSGTDNTGLINDTNQDTDGRSLLVIPDDHRRWSQVYMALADNFREGIDIGMPELLQERHPSDVREVANIVWSPNRTTVRQVVGIRCQWHDLEELQTDIYEGMPEGQLLDLFAGDIAAAADTISDELSNHREVTATICDSIVLSDRTDLMIELVTEMVWQPIPPGEGRRIIEEHTEADSWGSVIVYDPLDLTNIQEGGEGVIVYPSTADVPTPEPQQTLLSVLGNG